MGRTENNQGRGFGDNSVLMGREGAVGGVLFTMRRLFCIRSSKARLGDGEREVRKGPKSGPCSG